ncbi:hypothetical protein SAMN05216428_102256 [Nitrosospira sp. Nsp11]|nr:hypothetical protein SAMN05216428_102256 [Nitrosospira sp. Nsp11]
MIHCLKLVRNVQRFRLKQGCFDKPSVQPANYYLIKRAHTGIINKVMQKIRMVTAAHDFTWQ